MDGHDYECPLERRARSNSFPNLRDLVFGGAEPPTPPCPRRRANSEVVPMDKRVARVVSETDLQRIDKRATFATHAMVQPAELLARLVSILGYIPPPCDDDDAEPSDMAGLPALGGGVQGFSERDILANEAPAWGLAAHCPVSQVFVDAKVAAATSKLESVLELCVKLLPGA